MATDKKNSVYQQEKDILEYLEKHGTITPIEALNQFGCMRLSARISRLREAGHEIVTEQDGPHDYATYRLVKSNS